MLPLISFLLADSSCEPREESENYKMKNSCPQRDSNPLIAYKTGAFLNDGTFGNNFREI